MDRVKHGMLKAFTLLELIIVIAIIGILAAIIIPNTAEYMRDSKTTSANDRAQQLYMAAQDYLVNLQIKGYTTADIEAIFGKDSSTGLGMIAFQNKAGVALGAPEVQAAGGNSTKGQAAGEEILEKMSGDFQGAWMIVVYPKTFTVKYAIYTEQADLTVASNPYNITGVQHIGQLDGANLYTSIYGNTNKSQEYNNKYDTLGNKYIGQYPIPVA